MSVITRSSTACVFRVVLYLVMVVGVIVLGGAGIGVIARTITELTNMTAGWDVFFAVCVLCVVVYYGCVTIGDIHKTMIDD